MIKRALISYLLMINIVYASEQVFQFANPSFSGQGFSSHALTIEQEEFSRKQAILQQQKADAAAAAAAAQNTNLAKFLNNVESRIYAQLSLQLSNAMFSDGSTTGTMQFEGSTISWIKDTVAQTISLTIVDANNNATNITVPIGSFKF
jgi:Type VIII secretion system (T8SS), CsgF protein